MSIDIEKILLENQKLTGIIQESPFSIAIYRADGTPDLANKALNKLWNVDEATSQYLMQNYNLLRDEQLQKNGQMEYILKALKGEITWIPPIKYDYQQTNDTKDCELKIFWVRSVIYPIFNEKKEVTHLVLMSEDFTERMEFEENLKKFNDILQKRVEEEVSISKAKDAIIAEKSRMAAIVDTLGAISHHWRQPLNALSWLIQDIEDAYENGEVSKEYIQNLKQHSMELIQQMSEIIHDFRKYLSKPEQEQFELQDALVYEIENYISIHNKTGKWIDLKLDGDARCTVSGSKSGFTKVLHTLLENSCEAISANNINTGKIIVNVGRENENKEVVISIEDNGGGIKENTLPLIFDPYFSTKNIKNGHGLSLFMAKTIIEKNMEGSLSVKNNNSGAVFTIQLKIVNAILKS